jgi:hypothetical protein
LLGQYVQHDALVAWIQVEQVDLDPAQRIRPGALPQPAQMKLGVLVVVRMMMVVAIVVVLVVMLSMLVVMARVLVLATRVVVLMAMLMTVFMVAVVTMVMLRRAVAVFAVGIGLIFVEAVGMGIKRDRFAATARVEAQPFTLFERGQGCSQTLALRRVARRMFEANKVDARNGQVKTQLFTVQAQMPDRLAMDMRLVLTQGLGGGLIHQTNGQQQGDRAWGSEIARFFHRQYIRRE